MQYRRDIDGIRAIAILLVTVFHFHLFGGSDAGFIGVDVFFVISGYLISSLIWKDLEAGTFSLSRFYARRVRRLAPALFAMQLLLLVAATVFLLPSEVLGLVKETLAAQLYVSNIYYWKSLNYFGIHASSAYLLHTWSLAVEEQFYLFYPWFLLAVHRWARRWLPMMLALLVLASFALNLALVAAKPEAAFYLLPGRAWEMAVGALLPFAMPWFDRSRAARTCAAPLAIGMMVAALWLHTPDTPFPGWFALLPVAASGLLLLAGTGASNPVSRLLELPPLRFFGLISYPLYLVHWPIHVFATNVLPEYGIAARWLCFALSILLAWAITRWLEMPVRERRWLQTAPALWRGYCAGVLLTVALACSAWVSSGWALRFPAAVRRVADVARDGDGAGEAWSFRLGDRIADRIRPLGAAGVKPVWFIYGDSHASALARAVSIWLAGRGEAGEVAFTSGCLPLLEEGTATCREFNRQALDYARNRKVLLISIWRQPLDPGYHGAGNTLLVGAAARQDFSRAMFTSVAALRANAAHVYVWEPLPTALLPVPQAAARNLAFGNHWAFARTLASHRQQMGFVSQALDRAGVPQSDRIDPAPAMCPGGQCSFLMGSLPLYVDTNHPAGRTAPWFAKLLTPLGK